MQYTAKYDSPQGGILLAADEGGLTGLWFENQKYFAQGLGAAQESETPVLLETKRWLDIYFSGKEPDFTPELNPSGSPFQLEVWEFLLEIPYGGTASYSEIAKRLAKKRGLESFSARAVGTAVGRNRISVIIPCHRVIGSDGKLTGYAGGLDRKSALLRLEKADIKF